MIVSDGTILDLIQSGVMSIEPFDQSKLTPNGYDFSLGDKVVIEPNQGLQVETLESVSLPGFMGSMMFLRSSYARKGLIASFGFVDAGFRGKIRFYVKNIGTETVEIVKEKGIFQMIFLNMDKEALKTYELRSGHYQNQGLK
ncbi:MAG: dCTP deaminase [Thermoplasmata archaeon]